MIGRTIEKVIRKSVTQWPVTMITGARQVGKSTLCGIIKADMGYNYVTLDDPMKRNAALSDPAMFLELHPWPLIIDEIQYAPELFDHIEHIVNKEKFEKGNNRGMFIITGSHAYSLMENVTQSLAGRVNIVNMSPLSMSEIRSVKEEPFNIDIQKIAKRTSEYKMGPLELYDVILRGMYPELHDDLEKDTEEFYRNYMNTYLERDVSMLINIQDKTKFSNFLSILASLTGQELVYETLAKAVGVTSNTIRSWVNVLATGHIIRLVQPFYDTSMIKRIVKHPKIYFTDTGLACYLMGLYDAEMMSKGVYKGRLVETYIVNEIMKSYDNNAVGCKFFYYRDNNGNEIDLMMLRNAELQLIECKSGISFSKNDVKAFSQMKGSSYETKGACIICNTDTIYPVSEGVLAIPITSI
jgi:Predicted ATPase (AAA+ superfamily)